LDFKKPGEGWALEPLERRPSVEHKLQILFVPTLH